MAEEKKWELADAAAEFYEEHFVPAIFAEWAPLLTDAGGVEPGQRILDVGCGTGIVARVVADRIGERGEVTGIDLNPSMIKVARRLRPDLEWHEGDVASLPFADGSFDVVLSQAALMFFPDQVAALREMRRVLCKGGHLALLVWGASAGYDLTAEILEGVAGKDAADIFRAPFSLREPSDVTSLVAEAGFTSTNLQTHQGTARFPSMEAFVRAEIEGWVLRERVDVDAMLSEARDKLEPFSTASGAVHIPLDGHIVTASKD